FVHGLSPTCGDPASEIVRRVEAPRQGGEVSESVRRHQAGVLDAHAAQADLVEARLDRDDFAGPQRIVQVSELRLLVDLQADAVTRRVDHPGPGLVALEAIRRRAVAALD